MMFILFIEIKANLRLFYEKKSEDNRQCTHRTTGLIVALQIRLDLIGDRHECPQLSLLSGASPPYLTGPASFIDRATQA